MMKENIEERIKLLNEKFNDNENLKSTTTNNNSNFNHINNTIINK